MATAPNCTLAGQPILATGNVGWAFVPGVKPHEQTFELTRGAAILVLLHARRGPVELHLEPPGRAPLDVLVHVLGPVATTNPERIAVRVADPRWLLSRSRMVFRANVRRRTGDAFYLREEGDFIQLAPLAPDVQYRRNTLIPPALTNAWEPRDALVEVMTRATRRIAGFAIDRKLPVGTDIEELIIEGDTHDVAIAKVLAAIPGSNLWCDERGKMHVYDEHDGFEAPILAAAADPIVGPQLSIQGDHALERPRWAEVYFLPEIELRIDALEEVADRSRTVTTTGEARRILENVIENVDPKLTLTDGTEVAAGVMVEASEYFASIKVATPAMDLGASPFDKVARHWHNPGFAMEITGAYTGEPDAILSARWQSIKNHFRQTYRFDRRLTDTIIGWRPERVAIFDFVHGTRGLSPVYSNYAVFPTVRGRLPIGGGLAEPVGWNVTGMPNGVTTRLADAKRAPAAVVPMDRDAGIFRVVYATDPYGRVADYAPSACLGADGTTSSITDLDPRRAGRKGFRALRSSMRLAPSHVLSTVVTVVPAAKNDISSLHKVIVRPDQVERFIGRVGPATGPPIQLFIPPSPTTTARFAWEDDLQTSAEALLGIVGGAPLLGPPVNFEHVQALALAETASMYLGFTDRREGRHVTVWDPAARPGGSIAGVAHYLTPKGEALTARDLPPPTQSIDPDAFLPEHFRRQIRQLVQPRVA